MVFPILKPVTEKLFPKKNTKKKIFFQKVDRSGVTGTSSAEAESIIVM